MNTIFTKAYNGEFLSVEEGIEIYKNAKTSDLIFIANQIKNKIHKNNIVGWQIDRNINITNACIAQCKFCNFYVKPNSDNVYGGY